MKKLLFIPILFLLSCQTPGETQNYNQVTLRQGDKLYKIKKVYISSNEYIVVVYPINDTIMPVQIQQTIKGDDSDTKVTVVELK